jgi:hypothetical protein
VDYVAFADLKTIDNINTHLINALCARACALTSEEIEAIDEIEKSYLLPRFIAGK